MEKQKRTANRAPVISFLPKRRSFAGDGHAHAHLLQNRRGFSGPIVSIVPVEARRKGKDGGGGGFEEAEPTSPKVTCMGQVKLRKMRCNSNRKAKSSPPRAPAAAKSNRRRGASLILGRMFRRRNRAAAAAASVSASEDEKKSLRSNIFPAPAPAPALGKIRRFASGRETLRDFDWRQMVAEGQGAAASTSYGEEEDYDGEEEEVLVAHSAPLIVGGGGVVALEPKKEVNLWKRRTMPAPNPLQLQ